MIQIVPEMTEEEATELDKLDSKMVKQVKAAGSDPNRLPCIKTQGPVCPDLPQEEVRAVEDAEEALQQEAERRNAEDGAANEEEDEEKEEEDEEAEKL